MIVWITRIVQTITIVCKNNNRTIKSSTYKVMGGSKSIMFGGGVMKEKLFDSEEKVMEILWERGPLSAKEVSLIAADSIGWNKNTTYTVIKKLETKGFLRRDEPGFLCTPLVTREEMQKKAATSLLNKVFGGSRKALFSALLEDEKLTDKEIEELRKLINER